MIQDCQCLTNSNNNSDNDWSLPPSQYATHAELVSPINKKIFSFY